MERKTGVFSTSFPKFNKNYTERFSKILYRVLIWGLYTTKTIQITKFPKSRNYYIGIVWEEIKKSNKSQQKWLKNSQGLRKFATLAKLAGVCFFLLCLLLVLPSAFWFYSSVFQLISSCSSWIPIFNIYSL